MTSLLYAIGAGAAVNTAIATLGRLLRAAGVRADPSGDVIVIGVATAIVVASAGGAARRDVGRLALLGLAAPAAVIINRLLGVISTGRAPLDPVSTDAFAFAPRAIAALAAAIVVGATVGAVVRAYPPKIARHPPDRVIAPMGAAVLAGAIAGVLWPAPFFALLLGEGDLATALVSVPLVVAGSVVGGIYAARRGLGYRDVAMIGGYLALPVVVTLVLGTAADIPRLGDARFESLAGQIRATIALSWFLVIMRLAAWPLGAAVVQGFLVAPAPAVEPPPGQ